MKPGRRNNTNKVSLSNVITQTHPQISSRLLPTLSSNAILRVRQLLFLQITKNWKNFFLSFKIVKPTVLRTSYPMGKKSRCKLSGTQASYHYVPSLYYKITFLLVGQLTYNHKRNNICGRFSVRNICFHQLNVA